MYFPDEIPVTESDKEVTQDTIEIKQDFSKMTFEELVSFNQSLEDENEALINEQDGLKEQLKKGESYLTQLASLKTDFENFKRRTKNLSDESVDNGKMLVIEKLLPLLDSFHRADDNVTDKAVKEILNLMYRQFEKALLDVGVEELAVLGEEFNPEYAEAILKTTVNDKNKKNKVIQVIAKGYKYKNKIIRYAQVIVGA